MVELDDCGGDRFAHNGYLRQFDRSALEKKYGDAISGLVRKLEVLRSITDSFDM